MHQCIHSPSKLRISQIIRIRKTKILHHNTDIGFNPQRPAYEIKLCRPILHLAIRSHCCEVLYELSMTALAVLG